MKPYRATFATNAELTEQMFEALKAINNQATWMELASKRIALLESDNAQLRYDVDALKMGFAGIQLDMADMKAALYAYQEKGSYSDHERGTGRGFPPSAA